MRISDWSSDVCSSDLGLHPFAAPRCQAAAVAPPESVFLGDDAEGNRAPCRTVPRGSGDGVGDAGGDDRRKDQPIFDFRRTEGKAGAAPLDRRQPTYQNRKSVV